MAKVLQHRRGTTAEHANFTGAAGEVTVDTTDKRLVVHDGSTKGGVPAAKKSEIVDAKSELQQAINGLAEEVGTAQEGLQQAIEQEKLDIRALIAEELKKYLPLTGGTLDGSITFSTTDALKRSSNDTGLVFFGGTDDVSGAVLQLLGESFAANPGGFILSAKGSGNGCDLWGQTDGALTWAGKEIERVNTKAENYICYQNGLMICWAVLFTNSAGGVYWTFPVPFNDTNYFVSAVVQGATNHVWTTMTDSATTSSINVWIKKNGANPGASQKVRAMAVGYWM